MTGPTDTLTCLARGKVHRWSALIQRESKNGKADWRPAGRICKPLGEWYRIDVESGIGYLLSSL